MFQILAIGLCDNNTPPQSIEAGLSCPTSGGLNELLGVDQKDFDFENTPVDTTDPICPGVGIPVLLNGATFASITADGKDFTYIGTLDGDNDFYSYNITGQFRGKSREVICKLETWRRKCMVLIGFSNDCTCRVFGVNYNGSSLTATNLEPFRLNAREDNAGTLAGGTKAFDSFGFFGEQACAAMFCDFERSDITTA